MLALIATLAIVVLLIWLIEAIPMDSRVALALKVIVIVVALVLLLPITRSS